MTSNLPTLPDGWEYNCIGNLCEILDSKRKPISSKDRISGDYPYYGASGILDYINNYIFGENLVLIGEDGAKWDANQNTSFIATGLYWVNNHAHVIRPNRSIILDEYLVYYLNFSDLSDYITGATIKKLNQAKLKEIQIPLPPLNEQKRLVALLDTLFAKIDRSIELLDENIAAADLLLPSALNTVFGELGEKWETKTIEDVVQIIDGDRGNNYPKKNEFFEDEYCLFLSAKNVTKNGFVFKDNQFITKEKDALLRKGRLEKNDLVLTTRGTIGNVAIFDDSVPYEIMRLNSGMVILRIFNQVITHRFLYVFLNSPSFETFLNEIQSGSAQPQISIKNLKSLQIPVPPLDIQIQSVAYLDSIREKVEILKQVQNDKKSRLISLKASLLDRAFKGEL